MPPQINLEGASLKGESNARAVVLGALAPEPFERG